MEKQIHISMVLLDYLDVRKMNRGKFEVITWITTTNLIVNQQELDFNN